MTAHVLLGEEKSILKQCKAIAPSLKARDKLTPSSRVVLDSISWQHSLTSLVSCNRRPSIAHAHNKRNK